jgi:hypothetical protein
MASIEKSLSVDLASGFAFFSHATRFGSRSFILLMLKEATFMGAMVVRSGPARHDIPQPPAK